MFDDLYLTPFSPTVLICRIMSLLGADDLKTSEIFYSTIEETLACAECNSNIGQGT